MASHDLTTATCEKTRQWPHQYHSKILIKQGQCLCHAELLTEFVNWIFKDWKTIAGDNALDYAAEFSHMLGFDGVKMLGLMQICVTKHTWFLPVIMKVKMSVLIMEQSHGLVLGH
uniref:Uncharacterized protein n=1 Tax=Oryza glumipatula TaxID=40148 RepID=A0A0D9YZR7_9ORYZ